MNLEHHPDVVRFLNQLGDPNQQDTLYCPICGKPIVIHNGSENRISALCSNCDFHAAVPNPRRIKTTSKLVVCSDPRRVNPC